ncbi:MAG: hypothetical protein GF411_15850 [Candidatus Lokiarchaeota archaeon]|nr:hypothetical protein [Candidatus Lokiarchaeota archaeon]
MDLICSGTLTREIIGKKLNLQPNEIETIEQYLIDGGIITIKDDEWIPKTIILTSDDEVPLQRLNSLTEEIIVESMQNQLSLLEEEYKGTTSEKHGVPFEEALTDIWHDIFSEIIRIFIAEGDMVPMYENEGCAYSNFIWKKKIIEFPF